MARMDTISLALRCAFLLVLLQPNVSMAFERRSYRALKTTLGCDFDTSFCNFNNSCAYKWTRWSGSTYSAGTGPSGDHTSGSGYYAYVESSAPNYPFKGPYCLDMDLDVGVSQAVFYYSMYGSDIGTLDFQSSGDGSAWTTLWTKTGVSFFI
jgi:hypothetical protein